MQFTGSDFSIEAPARTQDQSSYVFILPSDGNSPPLVTISKAPIRAGDTAQHLMDERIALMRQQLPDLVISNALTGNRSTRNYALFYAHWTSGQLEHAQKQVLLHFDAAPEHAFVLTLSVAAPELDDAEVHFDQMVRDFKHQPETVR